MVPGVPHHITQRGHGKRGRNTGAGTPGRPLGSDMFQSKVERAMPVGRPRERVEEEENG